MARKNYNFFLLLFGFEIVCAYAQHETLPKNEAGPSVTIPRAPRPECPNHLVSRVLEDKNNTPLFGMPLREGCADGINYFGLNYKPDEKTPKPRKASPHYLEEFLASHHLSDLGIAGDFLNKCPVIAKQNDEDKVVIVSDYYGANLKLKNALKLKMEELAGIEQLFSPANTPSAGTVATAFFPESSAWRKQLQACPKRIERHKELAAFTEEVDSAVTVLERELEDLKKQAMWRQMGAHDDISSAPDMLENHERQIALLKGISALKSMAPWIDDPSYKTEKNSGKTSKAAFWNYLKTRHQRVKEDIEKINQATGFLRGQRPKVSSWYEYTKIVDKLPSLPQAPKYITQDKEFHSPIYADAQRKGLVSPELNKHLEADYQLGLSQCRDELRSGNEQIRTMVNDTAISVVLAGATLGASAWVGAVSAGTRMMTAARVAQTAVSGANALFALQGVQHAAEECYDTYLNKPIEDVKNKLNSMSGPACGKEEFPKAVMDYQRCWMATIMAAVAVVPAATDVWSRVRSFSPALVKSGGSALGRALTEAEEAAFRGQWAARLLNRKGLTEPERNAIMRAHKIGVAPGQTQMPKFTPQQLQDKYNILAEAGFSKENIKVLFDAGVCGEPITPGLLLALDNSITKNRYTPDARRAARRAAQQRISEKERRAIEEGIVRAQRSTHKPTQFEGDVAMYVENELEPLQHFQKRSKSNEWVRYMDEDGKWVEGYKDLEIDLALDDSIIETTLNTEGKLDQIRRFMQLEKQGHELFKGKRVIVVAPNYANAAELEALGAIVVRNEQELVATVRRLRAE